MSKFLLKLVALTLICVFGYGLLLYVLPLRFQFSNHYIIAIIFFIFTAIYHAGLLKSHAKSAKHSIRYYMGATGLKLFLFLMIILIYAFLHKEQAVAFALCFFFYYIFFTVFEVATSYQLFNAKKE